MILIDLPSVIIPEVLQLYARAKLRVDDDLLRRVAITQILNYQKKYKEYGKVVICSDGRHYWRRDVFPLYKKNRKKGREDSDFDWETFYLVFDRVKQELRTLPFKFIEVTGLEADDVIAILGMRYAASEKVMIISADKDLIQIQLFHKNVKQFSPITKKLVKKPEYSLVEHYIRGDSSDGIPNIFSDDDVFMCKEKRQKPISAKFVSEAKKLEDPAMCATDSTALDKYKRNQTLIDLTKIPKKYWDEVHEEYIKKHMPKSTILKYAVKHKLNHVLDKLG
jgi:5'-3' exonuclease